MFDYRTVINSHTNKPYDIDNIHRFVDMYAFMVKHNYNLSLEKIGGEKSLINDPEITHLENSVNVALRSLSYTYPSAEFCKKVYAEIDNIKKLYENIPQYVITYTYNSFLLTNDEATEIPTFTKEIKTYFDKNSDEFKKLLGLDSDTKILKIILK